MYVCLVPGTTVFVDWLAGSSQLIGVYVQYLVHVKGTTSTVFFMFGISGRTVPDLQHRAQHWRPEQY